MMMRMLHGAKTAMTWHLASSKRDSVLIVVIYTDRNGVPNLSHTLKFYVNSL